MVLGFCMFWIGCVFVINTAMAFGKVDPKETGPWNLVIGSLIVFVVALGLIKDMFEPVTFWWAVQVLLFGMTYVMLGINTITNKDSRGLGWYCLFVAVTVPWPAWQTFAAGDWRLGMIWVLWGLLWLLFWPMMALGKASWGKWVRWYQLFVLIFTLWLPGLLMLTGNW